MINPRIYFLRGTPNAREESLYARLAFKEHDVPRWRRSPSSSVSQRRIVICALAKQSLSYIVMRDEITIGVYFLDSRSFRAS